MFKRIVIASLLSLVIATPSRAADNIVWLSQNGAFTESDRDAFYSQDQGSRMIPYAWLKALPRADGQSFLADSLARYGYLPNPKRPDGLPVGFTTLDATGPAMVGMTCAACHTRQIVVAGTAYRIDGGPAIVDFQRLLTDLDAAVGAILADDARFATFAAEVKAIDPTTDAGGLKSAVEGWFKSFDAIVSASITKAANHSDWGFGRLDAISMIFNRVTGLDIGPGEDRIIKENMQPANAPARYPFLWNAATEAKTQWPGFAPNDLLGGALGRNVGEVMGVFARFDPQSSFFPIQPYNPTSVNFLGMHAVEDAAASLPSPKWPWTIDDAKAKRGETAFESACKTCHGTQEGSRIFQRETPVRDVCTDAAEAGVLSRHIANAGVLKGALTYSAVPATLDDNALTADVLKSAVVGAIIQQFAYGLSDAAMREVGDLDLRTAIGRGDFNASAQMALRNASAADIGTPPESVMKLQEQAVLRLPNELSKLTSAYSAKNQISEVCALRKPNDAPAGYEARYLGGVWAAAPYLHDGSVATLKDLLEPAANRRPIFKIGPNYDVNAVGLAEDQPDGLSSTLTTTDCSDLGSGRSRCGHEYGVDLTAPEKEDLLEYLKGL